MHAAVILGVSFQAPVPKDRPHTLDITLAQRDDQEAPKEADYLAQSNQMGSGELEERDAPTTDMQSSRPEIQPETEPQPAMPELDASEAPARESTVLAALEPAKETTNRSPQEPLPAEKPKIRAHTLLQRSLEIASLEARLEMQRQEHAKHPRIGRLTSASTRKASDAWYLEAWRRKIENVGNLNYPEEARRRRIYGSLRMLVVVQPDGSIRELRILESSGHKILDDAAARIVRLAEPFAEFPPAMRQEYDRLEIIRTWQFRKNLTSF